ncbi:glutathionylspermidine synthase family protein, partial [Rhizobium leguminosarum]|uniref:glutathionylspermidine synthase family protein n=1 Tax=Rhizobium leguminosarum TaxID=384 RepID=UPI003F9BF080
LPGMHDAVPGLIKADVVDITRLAIAEDLRDVVQRSWQRRDRHLYGRFDLAYDGTGPVKLLEYNADTPTSVFETAYFQFKWLTDQVALG